MEDYQIALIVLGIILLVIIFFKLKKKYKKWWLVEKTNPEGKMHYVWRNKKTLEEKPY